MGKFMVPVLNDIENTRDGVTRRIPIRRSKSFDASFWECHAMLKPRPSTLELEKSQWIIYHPDSPSCNGYIIPPSDTLPPLRPRLSSNVKRYCKHKDYRMWDNWDAALISLKREEEKKIAAISYVNRRKEINFARDIVKKGCCCVVCSSSSGKECESLVMVGKAVAALTLHAISFVNLNVFEDRLSAEKYDEVRSSLFKNVATSVLAIFDLEDFERIYSRNHVKDQYRFISEEFCHVRDAALISLKREEEKKIAAISYVNRRKEINFARDIVKKGCCCVVCSSSSGKECESLVMVGKAVAALTLHAISFVNLNVFEDRLSAEKYDEVRSSLFKNVATSVLAIFDLEDFERIYSRNHVKDQYRFISEEFCHDSPWFPFNEKRYEVQLTLELTRGKCFHVFDTLVTDTLTYIPLNALFEYVGYQKQLIVKNKKMAGMEKAFRDFVEGVVNGLHDLAALKSSALDRFQGAVTFPISFGKFGPCTEEVVEVMKLADFERRKQARKFIGLENVLFGLCLSRLGYCVELLKSAVLECLGEQVSTFSILRFYEIVCSVSRSNMVTLEDLVEAILLFIGKDPTDREIVKHQIFEDSKVAAEKWAESRCAFRWEDPDVFSEVGLEWTEKGAKMKYDRGEDFIKALQLHRPPLLFCSLCF